MDAATNVIAASHLRGRIANVRRNAAVELRRLFLVFERKPPQRTGDFASRRQPRLFGADPRQFGKIARTVHGDTLHSYRNRSVRYPN